MKIKAFCAWGDGPDVGINLTLTEEERLAWQAGLVPIDLTADEALSLAAKLVLCAQQALSMQKTCDDRDLAGAFERDLDG